MITHLGDITQIDATKLTPVYCVTGGSPCQDLSLAGKRKGLAGERSGLFMEMIRLIKEMRSNGTDESIQLPRYCIWENVAGAFSSNNGEDFRCVLEEFARVTDPTISIPRPKEGTWAPSGFILGDKWSIAWRVMDGQYFGKTIRDRDTGALRFMGTPQRRKRIALIADFGGQSAAEILFKSDSLCGNNSQSREPRQRTSTSSTESSGTDDDSTDGSSSDKSDGIVTNCYNSWDSESKRIFNPNSVHDCLYAGEGGRLMGTLVPADTVALEGNGQRKSHLGNGFSVSDVSYTLNTVEQHGVAYAIDQQGGKSSVNTYVEVTPTMMSDSHGTPHAVVYEPLCVGSTQPNAGMSVGVSQTLAAAGGEGGGQIPMIATVDYSDEVYGIKTTHTQSNGCGISKQSTHTLSTADVDAIVYAVDSLNSNSMKSDNPHSGFHQENVAKTLDCTVPSPNKNQGGNIVLQALEFDTIDSVEYAREMTTPKDIKEFVIDNNHNIEHQQDYIYLDDGKCGTLAAGTHDSAGHLIKMLHPIVK